MGGSLEAKLTAIAAKLVIDSEVAFRFDGEHYDVNDSPWSLPDDPLVSLRHRLVHAISIALYYGAYCQDSRSGRCLIHDDLVPDDTFVDQLSAANQTADGLDRGWRLMGRDQNGTVQVAKAGRFRICSPREYMTTPVRPGASEELIYSLNVVRETRSWLPKFYFAHSQALPSQSEDLDNVRFYLHCDASTVAEVLRVLTGKLNSYGVPFRIKCLNHPRLYGRRDALVLYVEKRYVPFVSRCLVSSLNTGAFQLLPGAPLFTKKLIEGVGVAEDPGGGQSFGQQRCRLLANAYVDAHDVSCLHSDDLIKFVQQRFADKGLDLCCPFVNAGSTDWFSFAEQMTGAE